MATYELNEKHLTELALLGIEDPELNELRVACTRERLDADAWVALVWAVIHLAYFEKDEKSEIKTEREQIDSFVAVEKASLALKVAIENLSNGDFMHLDRCLQDTDVASATNTNALNKKSIAAQRIVCAVAASARKAIANLASEGANGAGRKKTRSAYAGHIAAIAHQLMPYQLVPGDNGPFRRLCDAVFAVAGVPANSQGAIKYFNEKMRLDMKGRGLSL